MDDADVLAERVMRGQRITDPRQRLLVAIRLTERGYTARDIAERLRVTRRQVCRYLKEWREAGDVAA